MREFKKRQSSGSAILKFFAMGVGTLALFLATVVVVRAAWEMYGTFVVAVDARKNIEGQLESLRADHTRLSAAVTSFESPSGIEREIRERYDVARPEEGVIQIIRDENTPTGERGSPENAFVYILRSLFVW